MSVASDRDEGKEESETRLFLSYSRKDRERAQRIADVLRERHFGVYRDTDDILPTEEWKDRLESLIAEADTVVFLLSPNSVHSEVCAWEVEYATSLNKRVAPIVIDDTDAGDIPPLLARLNFIFCTDRDPFENAIDTLVSALNTDIEWIREHTRFAGLAQRWDAAGRPARLLLRGEDIADAERWRDGHPPEAPPVMELQAAFIAESRRAATRRQRLTVVLSLAALVVGLGLAAIAFWQRQSALEQEARALKERNQALTAQSQYLADIATDELLTGDGSLAILAALEAMRDETAKDPQQRSRPHVDAAQSALADAVIQRQELRVLAGHTDAIEQAVFSPDGQRIVTLGWDNTGRLWNAADGSLIAQLKGLGNTPRSADFTADGRLLVTAGDDGGGWLWDGETGAPIRRFKSDRGGVSTVAFSHDGRRVLTGKGEVFDVTDGKRLLALSQKDGDYWQARYSPDGEEIMTLDTFRIAQWNARTGQPISDYETTNNYEFFDYSPDGEHFLVSVSYGAARVSVRKRDGGSQLYEIGSPDDAGIVAAVFSHDGQRIATASQDGRARVWALQGKRLVATLLGHRERVNSIAFSPDDAHVVTASTDGTARVWNAETGVQEALLTGHEKDVKGARFSPDGRLVLTWSYDTTARLWNWRRTAEVTVLAAPDESALYRAEFIGNGETVFTAGGYQGVRIWNAETGELRHRYDAKQAAVSPDGKIIVTQNGIGETLIRRLAAGDDDPGVGGRLPMPSNLAQSRFSPQGDRFALVSGNLAGIFSTAGKKPLAQLMGHTDSIEDLRFSADGSQIATAARDRTARVWDGRSGEQLAVLEGHEDSVRAAAFTMDGKRLVTGSHDMTVRVWDIAEGVQIHRLQGHTGGVIALDVSPVSDLAASASRDGSIRLWDIAAGRPLAVFEAHEGDFVDPEYVLFSPDGRFVASTWSNGITRLHDGRTLEPVATYRGHRAEVWRVRFRRDGARMVTASWDGTARIWPVFQTPAELIRHAKTVVPRCLTSLERERLHLRPDPPAWCRTMGKWPYRDVETETDR